MTLQDIILIGLQASVAMTVFVLGMVREIREATFMFRNPGVLGRSLLAMDVVMPLFAVLAIALTSVPAPVKIALAALSVSPVPPLLPRKTQTVGGTHEYAIGLLFAAAIIAPVFVPLAVGLLGVLHGVHANISFLAVATIMLMTVLGPLVAGVVIRNNWPELAERLVKPLGTIAIVLLVLCAVPVIVKLWPQMMLLVGDGTLLVFAAFVIVGLAVGHYMSRPDPEERTVLAVATSSRHPGVAMAIATASFPEQKLVSAAIILYLLVCAVISLPYLSWRRRHDTSVPHAPVAI